MSVNKEELFFLQWNDYNTEMISSFHKLRVNDVLTDVTLTCESRSGTKTNGFKKFRMFKAHKLLLSVSSPYFREIFMDNPCTHPVVMIRETKAEELEAILQFIYAGQVQIKQENLDSFIKAAKFLRVRGLVKVDDQAQGENDWGSNGAQRKRKTAKKKEYASDDDSADSDYEAKKRRPGSSSAKKTRAKAEASDQPAEPKSEGQEGFDDEFNPNKPSCPVAQKNKNYDVPSGKYACDECDRTYNTMSSLVLHQQVHRGETTCRFCQKVLSRRHEMFRHMKKIHGYQSGDDNEGGEAGEQGVTKQEKHDDQDNDESLEPVENIYDQNVSNVETMYDQNPLN